MNDAEHMPLYVLFGVIMAAMLAGIFIVQYNRQLEARVDEQAQALVDDLARVAFAAFSSEQPSFPLPQSLGGSVYELSVDDEASTFIVCITAGKQSGMSYYSTVNVSLRVENSDFSPGGQVYFWRSGGLVIVSSSPISISPENILPQATAEPPDFYRFAKEDAKVATAIVASYFHLLELGYSNVDVVGYKYQGGRVQVQIAGKVGGNIFGMSVAGHENDENVGMVDNSWVVDNFTSIENIDDAIACPSVENAYSSGWLYSPSQVLEYLRMRTWRRVSDGSIVVVPENATIRAAAATTNVSTYPTWRVEWRADNYYVLHYRAMPWWAQENMPGFVFQSTPELEGIT